MLILCTKNVRIMFVKYVKYVCQIRYDNEHLRWFYIKVISNIFPLIYNLFCEVTVTKESLYFHFATKLIVLPLLVIYLFFIYLFIRNGPL